MLKYVYERLALLADEANHYIVKENKFRIEEVELNLESVKNFMAKVKEAFKEFPEALDEIEWLEMVLKNIEEKESQSRSQLTTVQQERE